MTSRIISLSAAPGGRATCQHDMAYNSLRTYTSHFMLLWGEVSWDPLAPVQVRTWLEQYSDAMETSCADSDDVSVREHVGLSRIRFGFCVVLNETASQTKNGVMQSATVIDGHCVSVHVETTATKKFFFVQMDLQSTTCRWKLRKVNEDTPDRSTLTLLQHQTTDGHQHYKRVVCGSTEEVTQK